MTSKLYETGDALCYVCEKRDNPVIYIEGANYPYDWVCSPCLVEYLNDGAVPKVECEDCNDVARRHYCHYHYDANIESERDSAVENYEPECYNCGDQTRYLLCEDCQSSEPECDDCGNSANTHLCYDHANNVDCAEYACSERVTIAGLRCNKHKPNVKADAIEARIAADISDDGSTITTDGITVKWEV